MIARRCDTCHKYKQQIGPCHIARMLQGPIGRSLKGMYGRYKKYVFRCVCLLMRSYLFLFLCVLMRVDAFYMRIWGGGYQGHKLDAMV